VRFCTGASALQDSTPSQLATPALSSGSGSTHRLMPRAVVNAMEGVPVHRPFKAAAVPYCWRSGPGGSSASSACAAGGLGDTCTDPPGTAQWLRWIIENTRCRRVASCPGSRSAEIDQSSQTGCYYTGAASNLSSALHKCQSCRSAGQVGVGGGGRMVRAVIGRSWIWLRKV
jgi:hypothetical protein